MTPLILFTILCFIGFILILKHGIKSAREMPAEFDEYSVDADLGRDVDKILYRQALRNKLKKIEEERKSEYKDRSDVTEEDLEFMPHVNVNM